MASAMEKLYRRRSIKNAIALSLSLMATLFGLFWLSWILWTAFSNGIMFRPQASLIMPLALVAATAAWQHRKTVATP